MEARSPQQLIEAIEELKKKIAQCKEELKESTYHETTLNVLEKELSDWRVEFRFQHKEKADKYGIKLTHNELVRLAMKQAEEQWRKLKTRGGGKSSVKK